MRQVSRDRVISLLLIAPSVIAIAVFVYGFIGFTGYSSMTYLRQLHIDTLKMDRTFIGRVEQSGYDRTIVDVIIQLGQTLHLAVVAEGLSLIHISEPTRPY